MEIVFFFISLPSKVRFVICHFWPLCCSISARASSKQTWTLTATSGLELLNPHLLASTEFKSFYTALCLDELLPTLQFIAYRQNVAASRCSTTICMTHFYSLHILLVSGECFIQTPSSPDPLQCGMGYRWDTSSITTILTVVEIIWTVSHTP